MKISIDAAAICDSKNRFGTFTFTKNILEAIVKNDKKNHYIFYSFCRKPEFLKTSDRFIYKRILPKKLWLSARVSLEEMIRPNDIFFGLNQAVPFGGTSRIFSFAHGLSFYFFKDLYQDSHEMLKAQLFNVLGKSEYIFVSSKKIKEEIDSIFHDSKKVVVLPFGIPYDMISKMYVKDQLSKSVREIPKDFFLYVGMNHPIKNIQFLIDAFTVFSQSHCFKHFKLLLIGDDFSYLSGTHKKIISLNRIRRNELKYLYQKASGYLTSSFYESFNFPVLEALLQDCPVLGRTTTIIPEFKKFTYTADHIEEFVEIMKAFATKKAKNIQREQIKKIFSWDSYVSKLKTYY